MLSACIKTVIRNIRRFLSQVLQGSDIAVECYRAMEVPRFRVTKRPRVTNLIRSSEVIIREGQQSWVSKGLPTTTVLT
jgi:hypothetical protein